MLYTQAFGLIREISFASSSSAILYISSSGRKNNVANSYEVCTLTVCDVRGGNRTPKQGDKSIFGGVFEVR